MIIMKQKDFDEILQSLEGENNIFIAGCSDCATTCKVGGEEEVLKMKEKLEAAGKTVTGTTIFDTACLDGEIRKKGAECQEGIDRADSILILACGTGVQSVSEVLGKKTHVGTDSLFVGEVKRLGKYEEKCSTCGECVLELTGGICPYTRCAKGLMNGPCGGYSPDGKCEVDPDKDCAWLLIYKRLQERGQLEKFKQINKAKTFSKASSPRNLVWKRQPVKK